jgi:hypothetical protein
VDLGQAGNRQRRSMVDVRLTDSEFCWRGLRVHKPGVTKLTRHGVAPVLKRAKTSAVCEPWKVGDLTCLATRAAAIPC